MPSPLPTAWRFGLAHALMPLALVALALAGCAPTKAPDPATTIETVKAGLDADASIRALASLGDTPTRTALTGWWTRQSATSQAQGRTAHLESAAIGERLSIGGGLALVRVFVLWHEQQGDHFRSWLSGFELIGERIQSRHDLPVGSDTEALVRLDFAELNRVVIRRYTFAPGDRGCCPSVERRIGFQLDPNGLYRLD